MNVPQRLPIEVLDLIFDAACELELFEQATRYPISMERPPRSRRRLKPFAAAACQVCRLWKEIIESSPVFWVSEHPYISKEFLNHPAELEQNCDLDLYSKDERRADAASIASLLPKHLHLILPRLRVLYLERHWTHTDSLAIIIQSLAQVHLPRLRVLIVSSRCEISRIRLDAPGLHHIKFTICSDIWEQTNTPFELLGHSDDAQDINVSNPISLAYPSHTALSSLTSLVLRISPKAYAPTETRLSLPSLSKLALYSDFPSIIRWMEKFKMTSLRELIMDTQSYPELQRDDMDKELQKLVTRSACAENRVFDFPALKWLTVRSRVAELPCLLSRFSEHNLSVKLERFSFNINAYHPYFTRPKTKPPRYFRFLFLKELSATVKVGANPKALEAFRWSLRFFDFSAVTERVSILFDTRTEMNGILLNLPHVRTVHVKRIDNLRNVRVPSLRFLQLCRGFRDQDQDWSKLHSGGLKSIRSQVESLQAHHFPSLFYEEKVSPLFSNVRKLILEITTDYNQFYDRPFPLRFPKLETLEMICSFDDINHRVEEALTCLSLFNTPSGQTLPRVELHGRKEQLWRVAHILRQFLPTNVKIVKVESELPEKPQQPCDLVGYSSF